MFGLNKRVKQLETGDTLNRIDISDLQENSDINDARVGSLEEETTMNTYSLDLLQRTIRMMLEGCANVANKVNRIVDVDLPNAWADVQNLYQGNAELKQRLDQLVSILESVDERLARLETRTTVHVVAATQINDTMPGVPVSSLSEQSINVYKVGDQIRVELKEEVEGSLLPEWLNAAGGIATIESINDLDMYPCRVTVGGHSGCGIKYREIVGLADYQPGDVVTINLRAPKSNADEQSSLRYSAAKAENVATITLKGKEGYFVVMDDHIYFVYADEITGRVQ